MNNHNTQWVDPSIVPALIIALPILVSCLDEKTKAEIRAQVEEHEFAFFSALGDTPSAEIMKETMKTVRSLLNVKKS